MAYKEVKKMEIREILRRWQSHQTLSEISREIGIDRKTVRKYITEFKIRGITQGTKIEDPEVLEVLSASMKIERAPNKGKKSKLKPYLEEIKRLIITEGLKIKSSYEILNLRDEFRGKVSISTYRRFIEDNEIIEVIKQTTCRIETDPGKEVQIDYAKVGLIYDPISKTRRTVYAFIATLSHSRNKYVEFVYSQNQISFVSSHVRMFKYFLGVTERILIDNLKSGVIKPDLYDPKINRSYQEMAEYYGCFIDPCRVRHPKDKGKVERDVQTIREQFKKFSVIYPELDLQQSNKLILSYLKEEYGQREHGTTRLKPYEVFTKIEQPALKKLPEDDFVIAEWKEVTVHPDCYIQFNKKAYSVPYTYVGKKVWVRGLEKLIQVYYNEQLIKQHTVTDHFRQTDFSDFPENVNAVLNQGTHQYLIERAERIGKSFHQLILNILNPHLFLNLRRAQGILNISEKYESAIIEQASQTVISNDCFVNPKSFKIVIEKIIEQKNNNDDLIQFSEESLGFVRDGDYFIHNN
jgi:transposase